MIDKTNNGVIKNAHPKKGNMNNSMRLDTSKNMIPITKNT